MKIQQVDEREDGFFKLLEDTKQIGKIEYSYHGPKKLTITHTEVDPEYKGQGLGKKLVSHLMDFVKHKELQLESDCSYASALIQKNPEYRELLKK